MASGIRMYINFLVREEIFKLREKERKSVSRYCTRECLLQTAAIYSVSRYCTRECLLQTAAIYYCHDLCIIRAHIRGIGCHDF